MSEDKDEDKPKMSLIQGERTEASQPVERVERMLEVVGKDVGKKATDGALLEVGGVTPAEHGTELLDTLKDLIQLAIEIHKDRDETSEKIQNLFFLFGRLAFTQRGQLYSGIISNQENDIDLRAQKYEYARLYDAITTFEGELSPVTATESKRILTKYGEGDWSDSRATELIAKGFNLVRIILNKDLPHTYYESRDNLLREIKALILKYGMEIDLPGKDPDDVTRKRFERDVEELVDQAWSEWREGQA